ncbi:MAG: ArnT family glycosyltransferase [Phycisphaerae bacterium]
MSHNKNRQPAFALTMILLLAGLLRLPWLADAPPGLHPDEAASTWNAYCLLRTGMDQVGVSWPMFYSRGLGANRSTLYYYLTMPFQAVGGLGVWTARLPVATAGIGAVLALYWVASALFGRWIGLMAALLLALNPWAITLSRIGHDACVAPLLTAAALGSMLWASLPIAGPGDGLARAIRCGLSGLLCAVACYGYPSIRIFIPVMLIVLLVANRRAWRDLFQDSARRRACAVFVVAFMALFGPLAIKHLIDPAIAKRSASIWITNDAPSLRAAAWAILSRYAAHFSPDFLFLHGDANVGRGVPGIGPFHWYALPLLALGFIRCASRCVASPSHRAALMLVLLYPISDLLFSAPGPHAFRSATGLIGLVLVCAIGAQSAIAWVRTKNAGVARLAFGLLLLTMGASTAAHAAYYMTKARHLPEVRREFHADLVEAGAWLKPRWDQYEAIFCTNKGMNMPYIVMLVATDYDPARWFREPRSVHNPGEWDLYTRFGKFYTMYHPVFFAPAIEALQSNSRPDRVLFILRPGEVTDTRKIVHEIRDSMGRPTLVLIEDVL